MAPSGSGDPQDESAKHMFDRIGEEVHKKVHTAALQRGKGLHGLLSQAKFSDSTRVPTDDPCQLNHKIHTNVSWGVINPCKHKSEKRFSEVSGGECADSKIKGNKGSNGGACAPYRRLHVCDRNLEQIDPAKITTTHNLLVDVCQAAKFEGQSITEDYPKYVATYNDSPSKMCTMLARSFADIGDIVRGKDLYLGNKKKNQDIREKEKLENKLKEYFEKIYNSLESSIKSNYNNDTKNYYKLREDWWALNRQDVWKAITCSAAGNTYFRKTACSGGTSSTNDKCRCISGDPPTYFDYVPQYLRWFEEWAEDFCRKKKIYVGIVKKYCREKDKDGNQRYCSRNGCDCEQTVNARGKLRYGKQCISCLFACNPYVDWINNQKEQFDKQKQKYEKEMEKYTNGESGSSRQKRAATTTKYDGYESKFYKELQSNEYGTVDAFLEKLSKDKECEKVQDTEGGKIDFKEVKSSSASDTSGTNDKEKGTFYRSDYCQPCPPCGVERKGDNWEPKEEDEKCKSGNIYKPKNEEAGTPITILKSGEGEKDIAEKLKKFCAQINRGTTNNGGNGTGGGAGGGGSDSKELYEDWKCYQPEELTKDGQDVVEDDDDEDVQKVKAAGGLCILKNEKEEEEKKSEKKTADEPKEIQKTYNDFFYYWVAHMLKDSIHWRMKKLERCLQNGNRIKCGKNCNNDCGCFEKWIDKKKNEWDKIKEQFRKQKGFDSEGVNSSPSSFKLGMTADVVLEMALELEFENKNTEEDKKNNVSAQEAEEIKHLREIIQKKKKRRRSSWWQWYPCCLRR